MAWVSCSSGSPPSNRLRLTETSPVLVNVNTLRTAISFGFSSHASSWVQERGYLFVFGVYVAVLFVMFGLIPLFYFYGKTFRAWTSGCISGDDGPNSANIRSAVPKSDASVGSSTALETGLSRTETNVSARPNLPRSATIGSIDRTLNRVMTKESGEDKNTTTQSTESSMSKTNLTSVAVKEEA